MTVVGYCDQGCETVGVGSEISRAAKRKSLSQSSSKLDREVSMKGMEYCTKVVFVDEVPSSASFNEESASARPKNR